MISLHFCKRDKCQEEREREKERSECILDSAERLRVRGHLCREVENV